MIAHGPFEIVVQGRRISSGAFPNTSDNPFATMEVSSFSVRYKGKPVTVTHREVTLSTFWRVVRLVDAPRPALLAATTDFHLITKEEGRLVTRSFGERSTNMAQYQWLDAGHGQPAAAERFGVERVELERGTRLQNGRWLRLSYHTVLDVKTLRSHEIRPWIRASVPEPPFVGLNASNSAALAFSPEQTQYASFGHRNDPARGGRPSIAMLVNDLGGKTPYGVAIDRNFHRFQLLEELTPAWFAHYFHWIRNAQGEERLVPRPDVHALPWQGRFSQFGATAVEFRVQPTNAEMPKVLARFIVERFGGTPALDWIDSSKTSNTTFKVPGCAHVIAIGSHEDQTSIFTPPLKGFPQPGCDPLVRTIGTAINAELAKGAFREGIGVY